MKNENEGMETPQKPPCRNTTADTCSLTFSEYTRLSTLAECLREQEKTGFRHTTSMQLIIGELERFIGGFEDKIWVSPETAFYDAAGFPKEDLVQ
jgi:hypothetical protein